MGDGNNGNNVVAGQSGSYTMEETHQRGESRAGSITSEDMKTYDTDAESIGDSSMRVSEAELEWAKTIKKNVLEAAVAINDQDLEAEIYERVDLDSLEYQESLVGAASFMTDFDFLEFSFAIPRGDLTLALKNISAMQRFRDEYQILESVEEAEEIVTQFVNFVMPGLILSVGWDDDTSHYHIVLDLAKGRGDQVDPSTGSEDNVRSQMGAFFYIFQAVQPDAAAMRRGVIFVAECEGMQLHNVFFPGLRQFYKDLRSVYPLKHDEVTWLRPPAVASMLAQFLRPVMNAEMSDKLTVGSAMDEMGERLDRLCFVPTFEAANQRLVSNITKLLLRRYAIAKDFRFPSENK